MQKFEKMPFNDICVEMLEKLLAEAKKGRINFFAYSACEGPLHGFDGFTGEMSSFYTGYYGLQRCAKRVMARLDETAETMESPTDGPADKYMYDVSKDPISHDFIAWLVTIKMLQAKEQAAKLQPHTKTRIYFARQPTLDLVDPAYRAGFFESVMAPALELFEIERVGKDESKDGRRENFFTYRKIVELCKEGWAVPRIVVPPALLSDMQDNLRDVEPVTITLREHKYWEHRNSSMTDWLKFASYLQERGEHVIFLRDYAHADEDITGFETMPEASKNFLVRAALYETAKCNLFVSNGPASLGLFGTRPWLQFIELRGDEEYLQNRPDWWWLNHGLSMGEQFPWSASNQRIVWAPDTYDNMVAAWKEMFPAAMAEAAE